MDGISNGSVGSSVFTGRILWTGDRIVGVNVSPPVSLWHSGVAKINFAGSPIGKPTVVDGDKALLATVLDKIHKAGRGLGADYDRRIPIFFSLHE
jgi:hypothetical protein